FESSGTPRCRRWRARLYSSSVTGSPLTDSASGTGGEAWVGSPSGDGGRKPVGEGPLSTGCVGACPEPCEGSPAGGGGDPSGARRLQDPSRTAANTAATIGGVRFL